MANIKEGLSVIIPSYNEEKGVGGVIEKVREAIGKVSGQKYEIIVVDDGSSDRTADAASASGAKLLKHPKNLGYGKAIVTGIDSAQYDFIAIIDADNTYDPRDLVRMIPYMDSFDMVIGARDMSNIKQNILVRFLRAILKSIIYYFTRHRSPDPNSGLRIFKKDMVIKGRDLFSLKFSFSTSLTVFAHLTSRFVEYITIPYYSRVGISKVRHLRDSIRTFILIISMALIYRPLKCFFAHIIISIVGTAVLFTARPVLKIETWALLNLSWFAVMLFIAMGYMAFILSQIYVRSQNT